MLPPRHIRIDARQLQASWDAEQDRQRFSRLLADLRRALPARPAGEPGLLVGTALVLGLIATAALVLAAIGGAQ